MCLYTCTRMLAIIRRTQAQLDARLDLDAANLRVELEDHSNLKVTRGSVYGRSLEHAAAYLRHSCTPDAMTVRTPRVLCSCACGVYDVYVDVDHVLGTVEHAAERTRACSWQTRLANIYVICIRGLKCMVHQLSRPSSEARLLESIR